MFNKSSDHKATCKAEEIACLHSHFGCTARVQRGNLKEHLGCCHYEAVKSTLLQLVRHLIASASASASF